tara:strand:+ start:1645 stop:1809 length:165 start_codon:yes stop_codon:yes gene_type:complete
LNKKLIKLYKKAEKALSREKAQKVLKKFDKKVRKQSLRGIGADTPRGVATTEFS